MHGRHPRSLSQRNYMAVMAIRAEAERLRQIDRGIGYGHVTPAPRPRARIGTASDVPLHVGPTIEAVPSENGWAA